MAGKNKGSKGKKSNGKVKGADPVTETPPVDTVPTETETTETPQVPTVETEPVLALGVADGEYVRVDLRTIKSNIGQSRGMGLLANMKAEGWRPFPNDPSPGKGDNGKNVTDELLSGDPERQKAMIKLLDEKESDLREMVVSLGKNGQIQPIVIRPCYDDKTGEAIENEYNVSAGARRTIAQCIRFAESGGAIKPFLDACLMGKQTATEELKRALAENKDRKNQSAIDDGLFYQKLKREHGMSVKDIAAEVFGDATKYQTVQQRIQLLRGTKEEIQRCHENKLGSSNLLKAILKREKDAATPSPADKPGVGERAKMPSVAQAKELLSVTAPSELKDDTKERFGTGAKWKLISTSDDVRKFLALCTDVKFQTLDELKESKDKQRKADLAAAKKEADDKAAAAAK